MKMTSTEFIKYIDNEMAESLALLKKKNADYSDENPFKNFMNSTVAGVTVEQGIMVRLMDKMTRVSNLLTREAKVTDESVFDTCRDISNYILILSAWLKSKERSLVPVIEDPAN